MNDNYNMVELPLHIGIDIKIDDIMKIPEGEKIIDELNGISYVIDSIFYRDNKVININISQDTADFIDYYNITLRYVDDNWNIVSPDEFPY